MIDPDELARRVMHRGDGARYPSSLPIGQCVRTLATECSRCKGWTPDDTQGDPICSRCGAPWGFRDLVMPSRVMPSRRTGDADERRMLSIVDRGSFDAMLGVIAYHLDARSDSRWPSRSYFAYCVHFGTQRGAGGYRGLAEWGASRWPRARHDWTKDVVSSLVHRGRYQWVRRLERQGVRVARDF